MFDLNFLEVGNPMVLGMLEEDQETKVNMAIEYLERHYGFTVTEKQMWKAIDKFNVDYFQLPHYLAVRFDKFNVV